MLRHVHKCWKLWAVVERDIWSTLTAYTLLYNCVAHINFKKYLRRLYFVDINNVDNFSNFVGANFLWLTFYVIQKRKQFISLVDMKQSLGTSYTLYTNFFTLKSFEYFT